MRIVVAAAGNDLVGDDAFGPAVVARLVASGLPPGMRAVHLRSSPLALLDEVDGEDILVLVDALASRAAPGALRWFEWDDRTFAAGPGGSCHGLGLREAVRLGRAALPERMPARIAVLAVEGRSFGGPGTPMSPEVEAAVPRAVEALRALG